MAQLSLVEQCSAMKKAAEEDLETFAMADELARLIDAAGDEHNEEALVSAIALSEVVEEKVSPIDACMVLYHRSNAWSALQHIRRTHDQLWAWAQPELLKQIYWLRGAIQHHGYAELPAARKAQIYCNLGNALSHAGRFVDALVEWRSALNEQPILGMARGNLGIGLACYGTLLYDEGHTYWLLRAAREELAEAIAGGVGRDGGTYPEALAEFAHHLEHVERELEQYEGAHDKALPVFELGDTEREQQYRRWCLGRKLFLNPLNDVGPNTIAAQDVLLLPQHRVKGAGISYRSFFNQLKQEYIYARWCLFQGMSATQTHFADRDVFLESNADMALYSIGLEQVKTAFRCTYSLLDKVAYFINAYWQLGIPEKRVSFRTVWFEEKKGKGYQSNKVRQTFETSKNLPLRGLFWIYKDIYEDDLQSVSNPIARELDALRNHLEHKFVKVVEIGACAGDYSDMFEDRLAHQVVREELAARSEYLVKLCRSALIYLSLAMHIEERRAGAPEGTVVSFGLGLYPDDLKL